MLPLVPDNNSHQGNRLLTNTGAAAQSLGIMYKALAQSVLLYFSESCVVTGIILKAKSVTCVE